jgi:tRNA A37 threonylcarbamoyladenosine synthetase subunit TsaC/SUA5/YrdC
LNEEESKEFDRLYEIFCRTGKWDMFLDQFKKFAKKEFYHPPLTKEEREVGQKFWLGALSWVLEKAQEAQSNGKTVQEILIDILEETGADV